MEINLFYLLCICLSIVVWRIFHDLKIVENVEQSARSNKLEREEVVTGENLAGSSWPWALKCQVGLDLKSHGKLRESSEIFSTLSLSEFTLKLDKNKQEFLPEWDECLWEIGIASKTATTGNDEKTLHIFSTIYQYQKEMKGEDHPTTLKILDELGRVLLKQKIMEDGNLVSDKIKSTENVKNKTLGTDETKKISSNLLTRSFLWILSLSKTTSSILVYILSKFIWIAIPMSVLLRVFNPIKKSAVKFFNSNFGHWPLITNFLVTTLALFICHIYDESLSLKQLPVETFTFQTNVVKCTLYFVILNSVVTLLMIIMSLPIFEALTDFCLTSFADEIKTGVKEGQSFIFTVAQAIILLAFGFLCLATKIIVKEVLQSLLFLMTIVLTVFYVLL